MPPSAARITWPGREQAEALVQRAPAGVWRGAPPSLDHDVLVLGDNLDALKLLSASHAERVNLAYIDPPYNTGKRFTYNDRLDDTDARSAWLSQLWPRLVWIHRMLDETGLLLIHIDEHEVHTLALLLDEIFGTKNRLGDIIWDKRNPKGDARGIATQHETLLCYAKQKAAALASGPLRRPKAHAQRLLAKADALWSTDPTTAAERFRTWVKNQRDLSGGQAAYRHLDPAGRVYRPVSMAWPNKRRAPDAYFEPLVHPATGEACPVPARGWRNPPATMQRLQQEGRLHFGPDHTTQPQRIYYLDEVLTEPIPSVLPFAGSDDAWFRRHGLRFDSPKPVGLATDLIAWFSAPGDLILDAYGGSGTTGHAVWATRTDDEPPRRFLLIQRPETSRHGCDIASTLRRRLDIARGELGLDDGASTYEIYHIDAAG